jgi:hypothetical protein
LLFLLRRDQTNYFCKSFSFLHYVFSVAYTVEGGY